MEVIFLNDAHSSDFKISALVSFSSGRNNINNNYDYVLAKKLIMHCFRKSTVRLNSGGWCIYDRLEFVGIQSYLQGVNPGTSSSSCRIVPSSIGAVYIELENSN